MIKQGREGARLRSGGVLRHRRSEVAESGDEDEPVSRREVVPAINQAFGLIEATSDAVGHEDRWPLPDDLVLDVVVLI